MTEEGDLSARGDMAWKEAKAITAGIDVGSVSTQAVILGDNTILSYSNIISGGDSASASWQAMKIALEKIRMPFNTVQYVVSTGYGRVIVPFTNRNMSEVSCHARGAHWFFPEGGTLVDMGGQDTKIIHYDTRGRVAKFYVSDKCAAGCGRYVEVIAELLGLPLESLGQGSQEMEKELPAISTSCVLFAKTEALALVRQGVPTREIMAAYCKSLARIIATQLDRLGLVGELVLSGGVARNVLVVRNLEERYGVKAKICFEPQIVGALGAGLFARSFLLKKEQGASANRG
jgi:benzoyl-CoA reductase subunit A